MTLNVLLNKIFIIHKKSQIKFNAIPKNSACNVVTSTIFKLFQFKLLTGAISSKTHSVHLTCPSDTDTSLSKYDGVEPYLNFEHYTFD